jgi:Fe2+ or Zn2+ uptake regulation protein
MNKNPISIEDFKKFLKKNELKATPQRIAVHCAMMELGHASADMVSEYLCEKKEVCITKASVYNILRELALLGFYGYRMSRTNKMFFDVNADEHPHMYDVENNVYRDIMDEDLVSIVDDFLGRKKFKGYTVEGIDIQILVKPTRRKYKLAK